MRTNIVIDDKLMAAAMAAGGFKTKREAVEEGLRLIARRQAYAAIRATRGTLHWDDSDEAWAQAAREAASEMEAPAAHEPVLPYQVAPDRATKKPARTRKSVRQPGGKRP